MEFKRLRASLTHNASESPSIYLAACAIESLIYDIEDEANCEISECEMGDETLPNKLSFICDTILDIYDANSEEMTRGKDRLKKMTDKIRAISSDLKSLSQMADQCARAKDELESKERELASAKIKEAEYKELVKKREDAAAELAEIQTLDVDAERKKIEEIKAAASSARRALGDIEAQKTTALQEKEAVSKQLTAKEAEILQLKKDKEEFFQQLQTSSDKADSISSDIGSLRDQLEVVNQRIASLILERTQLDKDIAEADAKARELDADILAPLRARNTSAQDEIKSLLDERGVLESSFNSLVAEKTLITTRIAEIRASQPEEARHLESKKKQLADLETQKTALAQKITELNNQLIEITQTLDTLQNRASEFENDKIPTQLSYVQAEQRRVDALEEQLAGLQEQGDELNSRSEDLHRQIDETTQSLETSQSLYDTLTADYGSKRSDLLDLEKKLADMKNKTDAQKHALYKKQLEDGIAQAETIQRECAEMEAELEIMRKDLEEKNSRKAQLEHQRDDAKCVEEQIDRRIRELKPFADTDFLVRLESMRSRLKLLSATSDNLHNSVIKMAGIIGDMPLPDGENFLIYCDDILRKMTEITDRLKKDLTRCAKTLKLEER